MKKMLLVLILAISTLMANDFYVLCEGNYGSANASLWQYTGSEMTGPVLWDTDSNPLGDVGQSLYINNNKLFIVMNNSHKVEVVNTENNESIATIDLSYSSPRYFAVNGSKGYLSSWGIGGIFVIDLNTYTVIDTITVGALPEDIIIKDDMLYTSITMNSMWSSENKVYTYDLSGDTPALVDTFEVVTGPGRMQLNGDDLYVASTYYDASWNTYAGMSKINLSTKTVTIVDYGINFSFSSDLILYQDEIYRAYLNGMVKIDSDCNYDASQIISPLTGSVYTLNTYDDKIYMGYTDYMAPDTVVIMNSDGSLENIFQVGAIPSDFAFVEGSNAIDEPLVVAENFELQQNYPNPFNPTTTINYNLPDAAVVKLSVYNMLGQHIIDLVNTNQVAGTQSIQWNAIDKRGNQVPTGVYFYQLKAGNTNITRKMIFMK